MFALLTKSNGSKKTKRRKKPDSLFSLTSKTFKKKKLLSQDLYLDDPYVAAATKLYNWAVESNDNGSPFPIWGTCLGHQLLQIIVTKAHFGDILVETDAVVSSFSVSFFFFFFFFFLFLCQNSSPVVVFLSLVSSRFS